MGLLRLALVSLVCGTFVVFLGRVLLIGLRTGRIAHTNTSTFCEKKKNPLGYWFLVGLFSVLLSAGIYAWAMAAYDVFKN